MSSSLRIGQGYDVHAFGEGRKLFLGGIEIAHSKGLLGHSDADVLLHALTDAVLGALSWGDIGTWFPNTTEEYRGADSKKLLETVMEKVFHDGWLLVNCDCTVLAEKPKLVPHIPAMKQAIAAILRVQETAVSIKATTTEKLGFVGREEGIAAMAVALLEKSR